MDNGRKKRISSIFDLFSDRDKASLDIFWLRDESLDESDNLPDPDVLAQEIGEDFQAAFTGLPYLNPSR